jgi:hypothetical protein
VAYAQRPARFQERVPPLREKTTRAPTPEAAVAVAPESADEPMGNMQISTVLVTQPQKRPISAMLHSDSEGEGFMEVRRRGPGRPRRFAGGMPAGSQDIRNLLTATPDQL